MISKTILKAANDQIHEEMYSAYLYFSMAAYFEAENMLGFATWMKKQAQEEMVHAMKFYEFINDRGGAVSLQALAEPPHDFKSPLNAFKESLKHEQHITGCIHTLYALAEKEKDYAFKTFLHWFIDEQVEEESNVETIIAKMNMVGDSKQGMYLLDKELGARGAA